MKDVTPEHWDRKQAEKRAEGINLQRSLAVEVRRNWPTASAVSYGNNRGGGAGRVGPVRPSLEGLVRGLPAPESPSTSGKSRDWPTATQLDHVEKRTTQGRGVKNPTLLGAVAGFNPRDVERTQKYCSHDLTGIPTQKRGTLNSRWVAQLMGYPSDWLDVPTERLSRLWATRSSRKSSQRSGKQS